MKATIFSIGISVATGSLLLLSATPSQAFTFGTSGIVFDTDTAGSFDFIQSNGRNLSDFGVYDVAAGTYTSLFAEQDPGYDAGSKEANDWLGTCGAGKTVANCSATFNFEAGKEYSFFLTSTKSISSLGTVFSTDDLNPGSTTQATFSSLNPFAGAVNIWFDDKGNKNDRDFNDFGVKFAAVPVPEPTMLLGLGLVAGAALLGRKDKTNKAL